MRWTLLSALVAAGDAASTRSRPSGPARTRAGRSGPPRPCRTPDRRGQGRGVGGGRRGDGQPNAVIDASTTGLTRAPARAARAYVERYHAHARHRSAAGSHAIGERVRWLLPAASPAPSSTTTEAWLDAHPDAPRGAAPAGPRERSRSPGRWWPSSATPGLRSPRLERRTPWRRTSSQRLPGALAVTETPWSGCHRGLRILVTILRAACPVRAAPARRPLRRARDDEGTRTGSPCSARSAGCWPTRPGTATSDTRSASRRP